MPFPIIAPTVNETRADRSDPSWVTPFRRKKSSRGSIYNTVVPALLQTTGSQIPVWEITSGKGRVSYVERHRVPGYRPIGLVNSFTIEAESGPIHVDVCQVAQSNGVVHRSLIEGSVGDSKSIVIPMSYYEPITA